MVRQCGSCAKFAPRSVSTKLERQQREEFAMPTIDAQVHCYERDHPARPWVDALTGPPEVTGDDMIAAMDAVGVDGAILVSVYTMYRFDDS